MYDNERIQNTQVGYRDDKIEPMRQVPEALSELGSAVSRLEEMFEQLYCRLDSDLLRTIGAMDVDTSVEKLTQSRVPLAVKISGSTARINKISDAVKDVLDRLEV